MKLFSFMYIWSNFTAFVCCKILLIQNTEKEKKTNTIVNICKGNNFSNNGMKN